MDISEVNDGLPEKTATCGRYSCSLNETPVEIVENILKFLGRPKDILNFALASRACYNTALALIYQKIDWTVGPTNPNIREAALRGADFLSSHPELLAATRTLRVSEKKIDNGSDTKLFLDYSCNELPVHPARKAQQRHSVPIYSQNRNFPETFHATNTVLRILPYFSGLTDLTLRTITLPRTFYQSIHALSGLQLRRLTLRYCRLTTRYPAGYDPTQLQLTELSIFNVHSKIAKLRALLKLARSPTLRVLRLDRSTERALGSLVAHGLPPSVHSLELDWRGNAQPNRQACELLLFFLNSCKFVRHIELTDMGKLESFDSYPPKKRLRRSALPALTSIAAPVPYLDTFLAGRAIDSVTITDTTLRETSTMTPMLKFLSVNEISEVLKILQRASVTLQSLRFNLRTWDKELFYMLARKQNKLKELHIAYQYGEVNDAFYMTLGSEIEFPHLERFHLYRFGDNMAGSEDERFIDQKEYTIIWQLYMPNLCEVALCPDIVWARSGVAPHAPDGRKVKRTWSRYAVEPMDGVEGLIVVPCPKEAQEYEAVGRDRRNQRRYNTFQNVQVLTHNVQPDNVQQDLIPAHVMDIEEDADFH